MTARHFTHCRRGDRVKPSMLAAVDVGSNAIRFLISNVEELTNDKPVKKNAYLRIPIRLGTDVFLYGAISEQKQAAFLDAMTGIAHIMRAYGVDHYRICATSAMRDAANGQDIMQLVREKTGLRIDIVTGLEEAQILFNANALSRFTDVNSALYVDVGGGSTEIIAVKNNTLLEAQSFQVGTLRMLAQVVAPEEWLRLDAHLARMAETYKPRQIIASGGNINKAAKLLDKKEGKATSRAELQALYEDLRNLPYADRMARYRLNQYRADVIVPALEIFLTVAARSGACRFIIPKVGLVDGMVRHMCFYGGADQARQPPAPSFRDIP